VLQHGTLQLYKVNLESALFRLDISKNVKLLSQPKLRAEGSSRLSLRVQFSETADYTIANRNGVGGGKSFFMVCHSSRERHAWFAVMSEFMDVENVAQTQVSNRRLRAHSESPVLLKDVLKGDIIVKEGILLCSSFCESSWSKDMGPSEINSTERKPWCRRYFRLNGVGNLEFYGATMIACISLESPQAKIVLEEAALLGGESSPPGGDDGDSTSSASVSVSHDSPKHESVDDHVSKRSQGGYFPARISSEKLKDIPLFPYEKPASSLFFWRKIVFPNSLTLGNPTLEIRQGCIKMIESYLEWYQLEDAKRRRSLHDSAKVVAKCWMVKRTNTPFSLWKERYMVMFSNRELVYFKNDYEGRRHGVIDLSNSRKVKVAVKEDVDGAPQQKIFEVKAGKRGYMLALREWCPETFAKWEDLLRGVHSGSMGVSETEAVEESWGKSVNEADNSNSGETGSGRSRRLKSMPVVTSSENSSTETSTSAREKHAPKARPGLKNFPLYRLKSFNSEGSMKISRDSPRRMKERVPSREIQRQRFSMTNRSQSGGDLEELVGKSHFHNPLIVERTQWQRISGNAPIGYLSLSPYSAKLLAEQITGPKPPPESTEPSLSHSADISAWIKSRHNCEGSSSVISDESEHTAFSSSSDSDELDATGLSILSAG